MGLRIYRFYANRTMLKLEGALAFAQRLEEKLTVRGASRREGIGYTKIHIE